jgi:hypothetical protein
MDLNVFSCFLFLAWDFLYPLVLSSGLAEWNVCFLDLRPSCPVFLRGVA